MEPHSQSASEPKKGIGCLKIILWTFVVLLILTMVAAYYVYRNIGDWSRAGSAAVVEALANEVTADLHIDPKERGEVEQVLKQFADDIRNKNVSMVQGMAVMGYLAKGPVMAREISDGFKEGYLLSSGLTAEEKQDGALQFDRLTRGVYELKIPFDSLEPIAEIVTDETEEAGETTHTLKTEISDEQVRQLIARAKELADSAGVPESDFELDLSAAMQEAINRGKQTQDVEQLKHIFGEAPN